MKILMVCLGNICRSPIAEGVLQHKADKAGRNWLVDSAGTFDFHAGESPHHLSIKVALENGVDIRHQKARPFKANDFDDFDIIYAMADDVMQGIKKIAGDKFTPKKAMLFLDELNPGKGEDLKDPYYGPEKGFHEVYELINSTCDVIIEKYQSIP